ncbi:hypothetical protein [Treponema sp. R6D11]
MVFRKSGMQGFRLIGEVVQNAEIAIDEWIETARLMERAIPVARGKLVYA